MMTRMDRCLQEAQSSSPSNREGSNHFGSPSRPLSPTAVEIKVEIEDEQKMENVIEHMKTEWHDQMQDLRLQEMGSQEMDNLIQHIKTEWQRQTPTPTSDNGRFNL